MKLLLNHNMGFKWIREQNLSVKGYAFTPDSTFLQDDALMRYLLQFIDTTPIVTLLKSLNGIFSFIYEKGDEVYLYCDKSRFFPLFFRLHPELIAGDEPESFICDNDTINVLAAEEFRGTGFTTGKETLVSEINQVPAGELVIISHGVNYSRHRIFSYQVGRAALHHDRDPLISMHSAIEKAADRFVKSIGDNTPVLPLSGGYDSRLIACVLKARGYENTICFTFGRETAEVQISKKVADTLGFKWYFISYENLYDDHLLLDDPMFVRYYQYASNLTSMFYLQEYPAMLYLIKHNLIPQNSIFLPGHSGDLLGGSQFVKVFPATVRSNQLTDLIIRKKFIWYAITRPLLKTLRSRIGSELDRNGEFLPYSIFEDWDIREKIAKFIMNSSRVFTFFGFQVRFLFWDDELVDFFRCLPPGFKNHKQLYDRCLQEKYFARYNLNFNRELTVSRILLYKQKMKNLLKPFLPLSIRRKYILKNDWACYEKLTGPMLAEINPVIRKRLPHNGYNSVIINWYLQQVTRRFSAKTNQTLNQ